MNRNNTMHVLRYNYKVEFQMRGAGHIHGVLWVDFDAVERDEDGNILMECDKEGKMLPKFVFPGWKYSDGM